MQSQKNIITRSTPLTLLYWFGHCGLTVLGFIPRALIWLCRALLHFLRDLLHGILRILRWLKRILLTPVKLHNLTSQAAYDTWQKTKGKGIPAHIGAVFKMLGLMFFSENGILVPFFKFAAPLICCAFLWSLISYGTSLDYVISVDYLDKPLGYIEKESDFYTAQQIVMKRLSYTEEEYEISFQRSFRLELSDQTETCLTATQLADRILQRANIQLCTGYGVYIEDEFYGTVGDITPIQAALSRQLSEYSTMLGGEYDDLRYAKEVRYEEGTFLAENLTDPNEIAKRFTETKDTFRTYTVREGDTVYNIANRYTTDADTLRKVNEELPDVPEPGTRVKVPVTTHFIPIIYKKTTDMTSFIDYDTVEVETMTLSVGTRKKLTNGVRGEKLNTVQLTYTDGAESERKVLRTQLKAEPVNEEIGVGIYEAKPSSTQTVLTGSGKFSWPLDGGRISDVFGGTRNHGGIDLAAPGGTNIYAADDGVVSVSRLSPSYGNYIIIDHADGTQTLYAHCSLLIAAVGQEVKRGQCIALVGTTGDSTGNHLHFEVRVDGMRFDPALFLRVNAGD